MSEPLTADVFASFEKKFDAFVDLYTENHADVVKRLERIEAFLWQGQRIEEIEHRLMELAKRTGHAELAEPFVPPPGLAKPAQT
jgi:hypothetical protein